MNDQQPSWGEPSQDAANQFRAAAPGPDVDHDPDAAPGSVTVPRWLTGIRALAGPAKQAMLALHSQYQADVAAFDHAEMPHAEAALRWIQRATDYESIADTVAEAADAGRGLHVHADLARQLAATARAHADVHHAHDLDHSSCAWQATSSPQADELGDQRAGRPPTCRAAGRVHDAEPIGEAGDALHAAADASELADAFADADEDGTP